MQPGTQSLLAVHLSSFLSTIQISYPPLENGSLITDDWKWVLRTATSTRPVMRFMDAADTAAGKSVHASVFSDTRGCPHGFGGSRRNYHRGRQPGGHGDGLRAGHFAFLAAITSR